VVLGTVCDDDELGSIMAEIDADHSGMISLRELEVAVRREGTAGRAASPAKEPPWFRSYEHRAVGRTLRHQHAPEPRRSIEAGDDALVVEALRLALSKQHARIIDLFAKWDVDASGVISLVEFRGSLAVAGLDASPSAAKAVFNTFDTDQDGAIDYREITQALRSQMPRSEVDNE
jgi:Ca2+-binding EF-hand superfamily protein